jgi:hypothetical protein
MSPRKALYLSVLPPEADVANRDPRSGSSLLFRRASASRPYHSQTSSIARSIRPQAAGETLFLCMDMPQGGSVSPT